LLVLEGYRQALPNSGTNELTVRSTRFAVVDGYVIDLAAGPPAKMALVISNGNDSANDLDLVVVHKGVKAHDICLRGPVHAGDGVQEEQSGTFRAVMAHRRLRANGPM
jgi:hypothetical protein